MRRLPTLILAAVATAGLTALGAPAVGAGPALDRHGAAAGRYGVIDLGTLGGPTSGATAMNDRGDVVGYSDTAASGLHAFLWRRGALTDLGVLDPALPYSVAADVNNHADVVGGSNVDTGAAMHAFLWRNGTMIDLGTLGGTFSFATGINDAGHVVGDSTTASGETHGFLWRDGTMTDLGTSNARAVNDRDVIVGGTVVPGGFHAYRSHQGTTTDLGVLAGNYSEAAAVNDRGWIAGNGGGPTNLLRAFLWRDGILTDLGALGGVYGQALAIDNRGQVLGVSDDATGTMHYVVWHDGTVTDLAPLGIASGGMGVGTGSVNDINDRGQIAGGHYFTFGQPHAALYTRD